MQIAIALFEHCTALDAVGPYEVLSRIPGATVHMTGAKRTSVRTDTGMLGLQVDTTYAEIPAPDILLVPGGLGQRDHRDGSDLHEWLHEADRHTTWTTSVCTGSLLLGAAGMLDGRQAPRATGSRGRAGRLRRHPREQRVVDRGQGHHGRRRVVRDRHGPHPRRPASGGGRLAQTIQLGIEYDPQPPFDTGVPRPGAVVGRRSPDLGRQFVRVKRCEVLTVFLPGPRR